MTMRIDLHANVLTRDGESAGNVEHAVVDPQTNEVTELVVNTGGLLGKDLLVPLAQVARASTSGSELRLRLDMRELEQLPTYEPADLGVPPPDWLPAIPYGFPSAGYLWPTTPPPVEPPERSREPWQAPREVEIDKGSAVVDSSGNTVGVVEDVRLQPGSDCLESFDIRLGGALRTLFPGGEVINVGIEAVDSIEPKLIRLRIDKEALEASHRPQT